MLTSEEIVRFQEEGYLVFERLITGDRLDYYRGVFAELVAKGNALEEPIPHFSLELDTDGAPIPGLLHKVQGVCEVEPRILELACEPGIVDRVGAGDSFAAGLIFALTTPELAEPETALQYATAASCLKHSIKGDFSYAKRTEIQSLMAGATSGRVSR